MRGTGCALLLGAAMLHAAPVAAQTLALAPGDALKISALGQVPSITLVDARVTPFEAAVVRQFEANLFPDAMGANSATVSSEGLPAPEPIAPGSLAIKFVAISGGKASLLVLENGYDKAVAYRARITVKGKATPTDVCTVLPGKRGFESWPYPIERIQLTGFALEPWDGGMPRCE
jgi:hypothetical protein